MCMKRVIKAPHIVRNYKIACCHTYIHDNWIIEECTLFEDLNGTSNCKDQDALQTTSLRYRNDECATCNDISRT